MKRNPALKNFPLEDLKNEINIRKELEVQAYRRAENARLAEEKRIYDLPENVEACRMRSYIRVLNRNYNQDGGRKVDENTKGVWKIYGEDTNCDMGGSLHEPYLATVEGTFKKAIEYAMSLDKFFQWGAGGRITLQKNPAVIKL